jgi:hypothetical protein
VYPWLKFNLHWFKADIDEPRDERKSIIGDILQTLHDADTTENMMEVKR